MLDTPLRKSTKSSCPEERIPNMNVCWANELNMLRKNTRRKLRKRLDQNVRLTGNYIVRLRASIQESGKDCKGLLKGVLRVNEQAPRTNQSKKNSSKGQGIHRRGLF